MKTIHDLIAAANRRESLRGNATRFTHPEEFAASWALKDHAIAMAEALARIAAAGPEILRDGYRDTELDRVCIARECLDRIVKGAQ